jgi:hypothetical protein
MIWNSLLLSKGSILTFHPAEEDGGHRGEEQQGDAAEKREAPCPMRDQRPHHRR